MSANAPGTHPRLAAALDAMKAGDEGWAGEIIAISLGARFARQEHGRRCECVDPILTGDDLMCGRCLLENKGQELRKLDKILGPHDFAPGRSSRPPKTQTTPLRHAGH